MTQTLPSPAWTLKEYPLTPSGRLREAVPVGSRWVQAFPQEDPCDPTRPVLTLVFEVPVRDPG